MSQTANAGLEQVKPGDSIVGIHESDLITPVDVIQRLLATGRMPVAGWPVLMADDGTELFYDTFAYRADGQRFTNEPPYHPRVRTEPFQVDSVGSCWLMHAEDIRRGLRCRTRAVLDLCADMRQAGRTFWVDPSIRVIQPKDLWVQW